jgi:hypothetical protein
MNVDIRLPNINGNTEAEQLQQIRSYLYQLAPQLNWALNTLETANVAQTVATQPNPSAISEESEKKVNNFNEIKSLIVKSADVVKAFNDELTKHLVSEYKAVANGLGEYTQVSTDDITESAEGIKQVFGNLQKVEGLFEDGKDTVYIVKANAYIKSGYLNTDDNGVPIYGIEVGEVATDENGNTLYKGSARFTSTKLSFFASGDNEVAYISNQQFYITRGEVVEQLRVGGYIIASTPRTALSFKWVGNKEE